MTRRQLLLIALGFLGIHAFFRFLNSKKAIILWYHGICDDDFTMLKGYDERHIPKSIFRKHLEYLIKKGYRFATMSELVRLLKDKKDVSKIVVLTFDDGFRNVVQNAYPIMKELNAKGCLYVVSDLITHQNLLWTDFIEMAVRHNTTGKIEFVFNGERLQYQLSTKKSYEDAIREIKKKLRAISDAERKEHLKQFNLDSMDLKKVPKELLAANWQEIQGLDKNTLEVGSHTRSHPNCANLTQEEEFESELQGSKADIEKHVGYPVDNFCYPAGSYNNRVIEYVQKYNYQSATTIVPGFNDAHTPLHQLRRVSTNENLWLFKAMISGSYFFMVDLVGRIKGRK